jgi:hypothetical protein
LDIETLIATRTALHQLAEHLLAGDLARRTGKIGLRPMPGGFGQPEVLGDDGRRRLRIDGTDLVVLEGDVERWHPIATAEEAAAFAGATLGPPSGTDEPETTLVADAPLAIDRDAAAELARWFSLVDAALAEVRRTHRADGPTLAQLWPEHFDLACTISEVNLGGSPGDADHPEPYLYIGPWAPVSGPSWNEPWGASIGWDRVPDVETAVALLEDGLARAVAER